MFKLNMSQTISKRLNNDEIYMIQQKKRDRTDLKMKGVREHM